VVILIAPLPPDCLCLSTRLTPGEILRELDGQQLLPVAAVQAARSVMQEGDLGSRGG
jgi:hypothetical protein